MPEKSTDDDIHERNYTPDGWAMINRTHFHSIIFYNAIIFILACFNNLDSKDWKQLPVRPANLLILVLPKCQFQYFEGWSHGDIASYLPALGPTWISHFRFNTICPTGHTVKLDCFIASVIIIIIIIHKFITRTKVGAEALCRNFFKRHACVRIYALNF
jgi:hypothetical protein